jgi:hypothetical protein
MRETHYERARSGQVTTTGGVYVYYICVQMRSSSLAAPFA